jgi:hypothetical protein
MDQESIILTIKIPFRERIKILSESINEIQDFVRRKNKNQVRMMTIHPRKKCVFKLRQGASMGTNCWSVCLWYVSNKDDYRSLLCICACFTQSTHFVFIRQKNVCNSSSTQFILWLKNFSET